MSTRLVQKRRTRTRNEGRELLEYFFLSELLRPSERLWIVSPGYETLACSTIASERFPPFSQSRLEGN